LSKKYGLGKGLGALIPDDLSIQDDKDINKDVNKISINMIRANESQPRKSFDENKLNSLTASIKEHGIIQPLVLKKDEGDTYTIIAGERRWRAAKLAGLKEIPAVIMNVTEKQVLEISLIENIQREDLNPIEEALAYKKLIDDFKLTQEELSERVGKSRTAIANCLRLLNLDLRVQQYVIEGVITEGHGRAILGVEDKNFQFKLAQTVIDEGLSVRETEKLAKNMLHDNKRKRKEKDENPYYIDIEERLKNIFGTKVSIKSGRNKGKIEIEYYSEDDLQRIVELLKI
jgi:ParB family transcriptional regulator, chromosome partitioning protein